MLSPEQLKEKIRSMSRDKNLSPQEVLQMYLFERVLERLAKSKYVKNFILKGGLLISSMIGIEERTTMDIDTTVKGISMDQAVIVPIIQEILSMDIGDGVKFEYDKIEFIREDDDYNNFRVYFNAKYGKINNPMKMDITTGDEITPSAIEYEYITIFGDGVININTYNLETILAEKYETVLRRNIANTRARDFYDLYTLYAIYQTNFNPFIFQEALRRTSKKRASIEQVKNWKSIINEIAIEPEIIKLWNNYKNEYIYAKDIDFNDVINTLKELGETLGRE